MIGPKIASSIPGSNVRSSRTSMSNEGLNGEAMRVASVAIGIFVLGMGCQRWIFPTHYVVSAVLEDPQAWSVTGSFSSPFELGAAGTTGSVEYGFGLIGKWIMGGANQIRRVPT